MKKILLRIPNDELLERIDRDRGRVPRNPYLIDVLERTIPAGQPSHPTGPPGNEKSGDFDARANPTAKANRA